MSYLRLLMIGLFLSVFAVGCGGGGAEGDDCHEDSECASGHCHIEDGEDHGACEGDEEHDEDDHDE